MKIAGESVKDRLNVDRPQGCFGLYGVDILVDSKMTPWLIEFTKSPAGHASFRNDTLMPQMIDETIEILFEIQERKRNGRPLKNFSCLKTFEQIEFD
jgi:predicted acetyltransferase